MNEFTIQYHKFLFSKADFGQALIPSSDAQLNKIANFWDQCLLATGLSNDFQSTISTLKVRLEHE